jgi:NADP-dependent 3-hydroxy acid dehydrogenase YdfG
MTTLAIVGAGTGLGAAVARRFGAEGFDVAVISRRQDRGDALAADLAAAGYAASVRDPEALTGALDQAANDLGPIEVLQYSPVPQAEFMHAVLDTTVADLTGAVEFSIYGPLTAVGHVLPGMRTLGRGTVLFVNGGSGARPNPKAAGTSIAFAGEGAYAAMLHTAVAEENIHVGQLIIPGGITPGHPTHETSSLTGCGRCTPAETPSGFRRADEPLTRENTDAYCQRYAATSPTEPLVPTTITRRDVGPRDVLIEIAYAGVCHSDIHTVCVDWGPITYPEVVGHEVAGTVVEVGTDVTKHAAIASVSVRSSTPPASATTAGPGRSSTAFRATRRPTAASTGTAPSPRTGTPPTSSSTRTSSSASLPRWTSARSPRCCAPASRRIHRRQPARGQLNPHP